MNDIILYANNVEPQAVNQVYETAKTPAFKGQKIRIMPDVHSGKGCVIGFTSTYTDKIIPNIVGVDIGCLDKDTEFLTPNGWKKMYKYNCDDLVLGYNKETQEANFEKPISFIKMPCEKFFYFKNSKGLDQMVSEEHKMLVYKGYKRRGYNSCDYLPSQLNSLKLEKGYYSFETTFDKQTTKITDTNVEIQIAVMIAADGCIRYSIDENYNRVELHFSKERKIQRAKELLDLAAYPYKYKKYNNGTTFFYIKLPKKYNKDLTRFYFANSKQLKVLAEESLEWDGHKGYRSYYCSTNKDNADLIQYAFAASGIRAGICEINGKENYKKIYQVTPTKNSKVAYCKANIVDSIDGFKYCFTMPTGYFVARRNGKIFITGNCGMTTYSLGNIGIDLEKLDNFIRGNIPSGRNVNNDRQRDLSYLKQLKCYDKLKNIDWIESSLGSLGGGNHFIEIDVNYKGEKFLIIHSGSRNLGKQVAEIYQEIAINNNANKINLGIEINNLIAEYKANGKEKDLQKAITELKIEFANRQPKFPKELCYLEGQDMQNYLNDVDVCINFAKANRQSIGHKITKHLGLDIVPFFHTIHNYVDTKNKIIRKGSISALKGEKLLIPLNMRDGCILGIGKGNPDWNYSAPHGAGRILSRGKAKELISIDEFKESMKGIYTTSVNASTIDESPMAYKNKEDILSTVTQTIDIIEFLKPIYNFKAGE